MSPWTRFEVIVLSAWMASALPPASLAIEPLTASRESARDELKQRSATDRWQKLKTQYAIDGSSSKSTTQPSEPARTSSAAQFADSFRPIPDDTAPEPETLAPEADAEPLSLVPEQAATPADAAIPVLIADEEPAWILSAASEPAAPVSEVVEQEPASVTGSPKLTQVVPPPTEPIEASAPIPRVRPLPEEMPRRTTQIRKIGDIAPYYDRDRDQDIRKFAAERAREVNVQFGVEPYSERMFPEVVMPWDSPNFFYYPLYFEDPALERYGHTYHPLVQPFASAGRFTAQAITLPYHMTLDPPHCETYSLGYYRPGECAPKLHYQVPLNAKAAAVQAATVTGLVFLIP